MNDIQRLLERISQILADEGDITIEEQQKMLALIRKKEL